MPTYVYKFVDTDETIEIQQSFHDDALTEAVHPVTGRVLPVKKVYLPVGVTFKGDGFYKTDSRSAKAKSKSESKSDSKSESNGSTATGDGSSGSTSTGGDSGKSAGTPSTPAAASSVGSSSD